jgi:DNA-binding transcriptional MerR regulator
MFLSFSQEEILMALTGIDSNDPMLNQINLEQKRISDQSKIVKDSLYALALRTPQINSLVNNELMSMELNLEKIRDQLEDAQFSNARVSQQFVITAVNNLALLLNEALENLEKQMADGMEGDQECENPGSGKPGMNMLKETSENIKQQLQKMIEQMKNGKTGPMSQQLGESLMQHEMMQQMLRDLMNNGSVGSEAKSQLQKIDQLLEQNRRELMNKTINAQTITRQNLITTRLLEAEKAEMEREFENKRESESATDFYSNPVKFFEYKEKDNFSIEYLNKNSHQLNNFYNYIYKQY